MMWLFWFFLIASSLAIVCGQSPFQVFSQSRTCVLSTTTESPLCWPPIQSSLFVDERFPTLNRSQYWSIWAQPTSTPYILAILSNGSAITRLTTDAIGSPSTVLQHPLHFRTFSGYNGWCGTTWYNESACSSGSTVPIQTNWTFREWAFQYLTGMGNTKYWCGLWSSNSTLHCWSAVFPSFPPSCIQYPIPFGQFFVQLTTDCGLLRNGQVQCWCEMGRYTPKTQTRFIQIRVAPLSSMGCGITFQQTLECWGISIDSISLPTAPTGRFIQLQSSLRFSCALESGTFQLRCWGQGMPLYPLGQIARQIDVMEKRAALIDSHRHLQVWGDDSYDALPSWCFTETWSNIAWMNTYLCGLLFPSQQFVCCTEPLLLNRTSTVYQSIQHYYILMSYVFLHRANDSMLELYSPPPMNPVVSLPPCPVIALTVSGWVQCWNGSWWNVPNGKWAVATQDLDLHFVLKEMNSIRLYQNGSIHLTSLVFFDAFFQQWIGNGSLWSDFDMGGMNQVCAIRKTSGQLECRSFGNAPLAFLLTATPPLSTIKISRGDPPFFCGLHKYYGTVYCYYSPNLFSQYSFPSFQIASELLAPIGTYMDPWTHQPEPCQAGSWSDEKGALTALCSGLCMEGTYSDQLVSGHVPFTSECDHPCEPGTYCELGSTFPVPCPAGTFGASSRLTSAKCTDVCPLGYYCPLQAILPIACPAGTYGDQTGLTTSNCSGECEAGYSCPLASRSSHSIPCLDPTTYCPRGTSIPMLIPTGFYSVDHQTIQFCPIGSYCTNGQILSCPPGSYQSIDGTSSCTLCALGTYQNESGTTSCTITEPGTYSSTVGQIVPLESEPGTFVSLKAATMVTECDVGTYSSEYRQSTCTECAAGQFAKQKRSRLCEVCGVNAYSSSGKQSTCQLCSEGDEVHPQHTHCQRCPDGSVRKAQMTACERCPAQTYANPAHTICVPCHDQKGLECSMGEAVLQSGYWWYSGQTIKCLNPSACPSYSLNLSSSSSSSTVVECGIGRRNAVDNVLCSDCLPGYSEWNESCIPCSTVNGGWIILLLLFSFVFWAIMAWNAQSSASLLGVYLYFIQIALLMMGSTVPLVSLFHFVQFAPQSTIASFSVCPFPWTPWQHFSWQLWMPFLFLALTAVIMGLAYVWTLYRRRSSSSKDIEMTASADPTMNAAAAVLPGVWNMHPWIRIFVAIGLFMYTQLSETILMFYDCIHVGPFHVMARMPSLKCDSNEWKTYVGIVSVLLVLVVVGFPAMVSWFLVTRRHAIQTQQDNVFASWSNGLYSAYRPECWYYMIIVLLRRTCCSCLLLIHDAGDRALVFIVFHLAALCIHWRWTPFAESISNTCETISHILLIWLAAMVSRYPDVSQSPYSFQIGMGICVLVPSVLFIGLYVYRWILRKWNQWRQSSLKQPPVVSNV